MRNSTEKTRGLTSAIVLLLTAPALAAHAQANPEGGDMGPPTQGSWQPPTGQIPPQGPPPPEQQPYPPDGSLPPTVDTAPEEAPSPGDSDHAGVVGDFGVGFFGVLAVPVMACDLTAALCAALGNGAVSAPTIGVRYWLGEALGIEAALGLNVTSGEAGALVTSANAVALHGGVPLALAHSGHFVFEVVPQLNFGFAWGSYEIAPTTTDVSGMLIEVGAKAGAEIHFGFIDIPQLSLQGSVGLLLRHESRSVDTISGTLPAVSAEQSQTFFGTGIDGEPWDIFTGAIAAVYYF